MKIHGYILAEDMYKVKNGGYWIKFYNKYVEGSISITLDMEFYRFKKDNNGMWVNIEI